MVGNLCRLVRIKRNAGLTECLRKRVPVWREVSGNNGHFTPAKSFFRKGACFAGDKFRFVVPVCGDDDFNLFGVFRRFTAALKKVLFNGGNRRRAAIVFQNGNHRLCDGNSRSLCCPFKTGCGALRL